MEQKLGDRRNMKKRNIEAVEMDVLCTSGRLKNGSEQNSIYMNK